MTNLRYPIIPIAAVHNAKGKASKVTHQGFLTRSDGRTYVMDLDLGSIAVYDSMMQAQIELEKPLVVSFKQFDGYYYSRDYPTLLKLAKTDDLDNVIAYGVQVITEKADFRFLFRFLDGNKKFMMFHDVSSVLNYLNLNHPAYEMNTILFQDPDLVLNDE